MNDYCFNIYIFHQESESMIIFNLVCIFYVYTSVRVCVCVCVCLSYVFTSVQRLPTGSYLWFRNAMR